MTISAVDSAAVERFRQLLRINTISGTGVSSGSYQAACDLLESQCRAAGLSDVRQVVIVPGKPIVVASWIGKEPKRSSLLLNGHYDVVPVDRAKWTCDPFAAEIRDGNIYARGAQDMKIVVAAYIEAIKRLKESKFQPKRTIHLTFVPDEELGGIDGMRKFVLSAEFLALNVGFAMDEGLASPNDIVPVYFGERALWWIRVKSQGKTGHASGFLANDGAVQKLQRVMDKAFKYRGEQARPFLEGGSPLGDIVTVNVSALKCGHTTDGGASYALNVIPSEAEAGMDIRIPPTVDMSEFEQKQLCEWTSEDGVSYEKVMSQSTNPITSIDPLKNPWWASLSSTCEKMGMKIEARIFPAATDSRFIRMLGIPCLGFTPLPNTVVKFHDHDEFVPIDGYLKAIPVYERLITSLTNLD